VDLERGTIEGAQRLLDALHGADRMVGVDMRGVGSRPRDEKVRHGRNWVALTRYAEDGRLRIDNNGAEQALRPIVLGRNYVKLTSKRE